MRVFEKPSLSYNWRCPICGKSTEKEIVLVGIRDTEDGNGNMEAKQIHLDCINLILVKGIETPNSYLVQVID